MRRWIARAPRYADLDDGPSVFHVMSMFPSFRIGALFGFPIKVNLSFLLLLGAVFMWMGGLGGLVVSLIAAGSVLLHELGHALMARRLGVRVADIELHFFGGAARMVGLPRTPQHEIAIAAAGPAVSFVLAGTGLMLAAITGAQALGIFGWVNLVLAVFNLVPAFPSDGGRILRALLARRRGLVGATEVAVKVGRVVCVALAVLALVAGAYQLLFVALVLWLMGSAERLAVRLRGDADGWRGGAGPGASTTYGGWFARGEQEQDGAVVDAVYIPPGQSDAGPSRLPPAGRPIVLVWRN